MTAIHYILHADKVPPSDQDEMAKLLRKAISHATKQGWVEQAKEPVKKKAKSEKSKEKLTGTMVRLGAIFNRRATTKWDTKEVKAYNAIGDITEEDLALLERYYKVMRAKNDDDNHSRRDLFTLLNNFSGELDRARNYKFSYDKPTAIEVMNEPEGWKEFWERFTGNKPQYEWHELEEDTKKEVIEGMANE